MTDSTVWWLLAGAAVALELVTGTFFLLMLAIGMAAGALAAHSGLSTSLQLVCAALVGGGAVVAWQIWRKRHSQRLPASANQDVNLDIGQQVAIARWEADGTAQVQYRGTTWTAALQSPDDQAAPGPHRIVAIEGSRLMVKAL